MVTNFHNALDYLNNLDLDQADPLDKKAYELIADEDKYERASQALRRRFSRGAAEVQGIDREGRATNITRAGANAHYSYSLQGTNGQWHTPEERIWIVAMYALWQDGKFR